MWKELKSPLLRGGRVRTIIGIVLALICLFITYALCANYLDDEDDSPRGAIVNDRGIEMSEEELLALLGPKEAVPRSELDLYLATGQERGNEIPDSGIRCRVKAGRRGRHQVGFHLSDFPIG